MGEDTGTSASGAAPTPVTPAHPVTLIDSPNRVVRRPKDGLNLAVHALGIALVLLLGVYAHGTTVGVTEDVYSAVAKTARQILLVPVNVLEGLVAAVVPIAIIATALVRRRWRVAAMAAAAGLAAALITQLAIWALHASAPNALAGALTLPAGRISLSTYVAALAGILTAAAAGRASRSVRASWYALALVLFLAIIQGDQSLPGALTAVLLGRVLGFGVCYVAGVRSDRASGASLVAGLRRAGLNPHLVLRLDDVEDLAAWTVTSGIPLGHVEGYAVSPQDAKVGGGTPPATKTAVVEDHRLDAAAMRAHLAGKVPAHRSGHRSYAVWLDAERTRRYDVTVFDSERQVLGMLSSAWDALRNRGLERQFAPNVKESAERAVLMSHEARACGVRTRKVLTASQADSSILLPTRPLPEVVALADLPAERHTDALYLDIWRQFAAAHRRGLAHHEISDTAVLVDGHDRAWLVDWEDGEIAASDLARRVDLAQLLTMTALHVGAERAISIACRAIPGDAVAGITPLLQKAALPARTRAKLRGEKDLLGALREGLSDQSADMHLPTVRLERFSLRSVVMVVIALAALVIVLGSLQISDIVAAVTGANPWWMAASFACGLLTYLGGAIGLVAFTPEKVGVWRTTLVQVAASIVSLVAPAGIGPAAMDLRFLTKAKVPGPLAAATVALTQVSRFVITVTLLIVVALGSGSAGTISWPQLPTVLAVVGVVALVAAAFAFPQVRHWVWAKVGPSAAQIWPRLLWALGNPKRLAIAVAGNVIMVVGYVAAFGFALASFGETLSPITLAITYLVSNSAGSVVPSPGGVGPVEVALTSGLALAGIPYATALSTTVIYRLLTFWGRVPLGWFALRYLEKHDVI